MKFPIPQDWDGESWCRWSICWPDSEAWRGLLRGFITLPQRGWTWDERTGNILDVQQIGREITAQNLPLNGVIMACNDTNLADSFNNIALAIQLLANSSSNSACCDSPTVVVNNAIQNFINQPVGGNPIPVYGTEPPLTLTPGTFPSGYESLGAYDTDKCRKANSLINATIATLRALGAISAFNFTGLTVTVLMAISGVLVVAPYLIPVLIGGIIALAVSMAVLDQAADEVTANKEEWVCALYEGEGTEAIIGHIADLLDGLISLLQVTGVVGNAVKLIVMVLLNGDNLNKLFTDAPMLGITEIDCASCGCNTTGQAEFYEVNGATWGTGDLSVDCQERELSGGEYAAGGYWFVGIRNTGANDLLIESISADPGLTNAGAFGGMSGFGAFEVTPNNNIYFGGNSTPFTMIVKISGLDTVNGV